MRIFNEDKTVQMYIAEDRVEDGDFIDIPDNLICDLSKGKLENDTLIEHIPEQQEIQEQWHYETVKEYENGGKDVEKVIDVVGQPYIAEHDEVEDILVYKPYSEQEIKVIDNNNRIIELKQKLQETDYKAIKYAEGELSEEEYAETKAQRRAWREEINKLEEELKDANNSI